MRTRLSAAYKGIHALLMQEGARDFRSGQTFDQTVFFDEGVDIHHIFPEAWCRARQIDPKIYDTIINKTPLGYRTNRIIGGSAPSIYLGKLERGGEKDPPIPQAMLDQHLRSHAIDPALLRGDAFEAFLIDREVRLAGMIAVATGHALAGAEAPIEGVELPESIARDTGNASEPAARD